MEERGVYLYRVDSVGGKTSLVHGYFTNFQAAERYVYDLYHSNIPLCDLTEINPDKAKNTDLEETSLKDYRVGTYLWKQRTFRYVDEYGDLYCEPETIFDYRVMVSINCVHMYINEGIFDLDSSETAGEWLEKHGASIRTINCMKRPGSEFSYRSIYYLADHAYNLYIVRNLGRKSMDEILQLLDKEGIKYCLEKPKYGEIKL